MAKKHKQLFSYELEEGDEVLAIIRISAGTPGAVNSVTWTPPKELTELQVESVVVGLQSVLDVWKAKLELDNDLNDLNDLLNP
jgi:hypothetical protein